MQDSVSIALGYFSVSIAFGLIAVDSGCSPVQAMMISMACLTSAGQFAGVTVMATVGSYVEMAMTQILINARYALMAISLSQKVEPTFTTVPRLFLGSFITDEIFAVAVGQKVLTKKYFLGLACMPYVGWASGTIIGGVAGALLPEILTTSLSVALYGMFIAVVVPQVKTSRKTGIIVLVTMVISSIIYFAPQLNFISSGFAIIISAVLASCIGAVLFPVEDSEDEGDAKAAAFADTDSEEEVGQ